jgi:hypothetical protein
MLAEARRFARLSTAVLVIALAVLAGWMTRRLAPPSHIRDGRRLPVDIGAQHAARLGGHHDLSEVDSQHPPSPIVDAPLPHFFGATFLALFVLAIAVVTGVAVIRRIRLARTSFAVQFLFAVLVAVAAETAVLLAAWLGYGDRLGLRAAFVGGIELARYAFVAALIVVMIFGLPANRTSHA